MNRNIEFRTKTDAAVRDSKRAQNLFRSINSAPLYFTDSKMRDFLVQSVFTLWLKVDRMNRMIWRISAAAICKFHLRFVPDFPGMRENVNKICARLP